MAYNKKPIKNIAGDIILPPTIFEQVKVSEKDNTSLKEVLESMSKNDHNHDDIYYKKQEIDQKEQSLKESIKTISEARYTKEETDEKFKNYYNKQEIDIKEQSLKDSIETLDEKVYSKEETDVKITVLQNTDTALSTRVTKLESQITYGTEELETGTPLEPGSVYMVFEE